MSYTVTWKPPPVVALTGRRAEATIAVIGLSTRFMFPTQIRS